jgi:flagellar basal-body rod protein FlgB
MFATLFNTGSIPVLEHLIYFTRERHIAIANNIANVETPYYQAIDAPEGEFKEALLKAIEHQRRHPLDIFLFEPTNNIKPKKSGGLQVNFVPSQDVGILRHTLNNVDIEKEMVRLLKNTKLHNLATSLLTQQFNLLRSAIMERII